MLGLTTSSFNPINFVKIDISPPNSKVVISTTTKVELTIRLLLGEREGLIWRLNANAIAPLILPLNHINRSCFIEILMSKYRQTPTNNEGTKTPKARANTQENSTAIRKTKLNFCYYIP